MGLGQGLGQDASFLGGQPTGVGYGMLAPTPFYPQQQFNPYSQPFVSQYIPSPSAQPQQDQQAQSQQPAAPQGYGPPPWMQGGGFGGFNPWGGGFGGYGYGPPPWMQGGGWGWDRQRDSTQSPQQANAPTNPNPSQS